jgi:hypothetical protein
VTHKPVPLRSAISLELEQVDADPPSLLRLREEDDASVFDVTYRFDAGEQGTRFTQISEFEWKKLPRFLHRTFARGVRHDLQVQLRNLKRVLEAQPPAPPTAGGAPLAVGRSATSFWRARRSRLLMLCMRH